MRNFKYLLLLFGLGLLAQITCAQPFISQVYVDETKETYIEIKNRSNSHFITAGQFYLNNYAYGQPVSDVTSFIDIGAFNPLETKIFIKTLVQSATPLINNPRLVPTVPVTMVALPDNFNFDGNNDILTLSRYYKYQRAYDERVDLVGNDTEWCVGKSLVRSSCALACPRSDLFDIDDWVTFSIDEMLSPMYNGNSLTNAVLGRHSNGIMIYDSNKKWFDFGTLSNNSNPDRSRIIEIYCGDYDTSIHGNLEACSIGVDDFRTLTITPYCYVRAFKTIKILQFGKIDIQNEADLIVDTNPSPTIASNASNSILPAGNLIFNNSMRSTAANNTSGRGINPKTFEKDNKIWLNLTDESGNHQSQIEVAFLEKATDKYDPKEDVKAFNGRKLNFYTKTGDQDLIIDAQNKFSSDKTIALGIINNYDKPQKLTISTDKSGGIFKEQPIYLFDKITSRINNISKEGYSFMATKSIIDDRFILLFDNKITSDISQSASNNVLVYAKDNLLNVVSLNKKITAIYVADIYTPSTSGVFISKTENINNKTFQQFVDSKYKILNVKIVLEDGSTINKKIML